MDKRKKEFRNSDHYSKDGEKLERAIKKSRETIKKKFGETGIGIIRKDIANNWYDKKRQELDTLDILDKMTVFKFLKDRENLYVGKSGNRRLLKDSSEVYKSLFHHCEEFKIFNYNRDIPFVAKLDIARFNFSIPEDKLCLCGKTLKFDRQTQKWDKFYCRSCRKSPTSKEHFKLKYKDGWEDKWRECMVNYNSITKGKNEVKLLDKLEELFNTTIDRNFSVSYYFPDGYSKDLNIVFEVNEKHHRLPSNRKKDNKRRKIIQKELKCDFVVIWDDTLEIERKRYVQSE
jgi:hypothetical protein